VAARVDSRGGWKSPREDALFDGRPSCAIGNVVFLSLILPNLLLFVLLGSLVPWMIGIIDILRAPDLTGEMRIVWMLVPIFAWPVGIIAWLVLRGRRNGRIVVIVLLVSTMSVIALDRRLRGCFGRTTAQRPATVGTSVSAPFRIQRMMFGENRRLGLFHAQIHVPTGAGDL
jgi:hypothetical protein